VQGRNVLSSDGSPTAEDLDESATEVRVEDVVDDGIDHGSAVLEPLEGGDRLRRDVRLTALTGAVHDVRGEERQVEHHEDGEQDAEHAHGASTAVGARQRRPDPATVGEEEAGTARLRASLATARCAAGAERVDRRRSTVADRRRRQRFRVGTGVRRTGCRVPDLCAAVVPLQATEYTGAIDAQLVDGHTSLFAKLASQRVNGHRVHDRHDQQRKVERSDGGRDDEGLRLRTAS